MTHQVPSAMPNCFNMQLYPYGIIVTSNLNTLMLKGLTVFSNLLRKIYQKSIKRINKDFGTEND